MRILLPVILSFAIAVPSVAQIRLSTALKQELSLSNNRDMFRVQLILSAKADLDPLRQRFEAERLSTNERAQLVTQHLTAHARITQQPVLDEIALYQRTHPAQVENVKTLWIANIITLNASKELILKLAENQSIEVIDLDDRWKIAPIEPVRAESAPSTRSEGGVEPGLEAIGARFMWNLGYTGRNRIGYTLDTGVWPDHPALRDRFLVNHVPMDHAWFPYDKRFPADKSSSHGTHVTGTIMGLDPATADTIGVAFNAYFICSDPVVSNLAYLKPLTDFLYAFEWALDPDGNPNTLNDVPDVINNSWGFDPPADTLLCESVVTDMLNAVELAGIANVFSAGNEGPDPMTIGTPNYVNTGLVNSFAVGALNGNTTPYLITNFSSRGPSPCGGQGSIAIKPEISAPGFNVRSSVADGEYDYYNGTSMASPHVSGGVLLLKEAFPMASGEEILLALYNSAIDLGDVGEDNTYGMGMMSLENAFNLLSQTFEPVPPLTDMYDLAAKAVSPTKSLVCDATVTPTIRLFNRGQETLDMVHITYGQVGSSDMQYTWPGTLVSGDSVDVQLDPVAVSGSGFTEIWFRTELAIDVDELDRHNNNTVYRFFRRTSEPMPFYENFESTDLMDDRWLVDNPDGGITWDTLSIEGPLSSTVSAYMDFYHYSPRLEQRDRLISPLLQLSDNADMHGISFDRFYTFLHQSFADTLRVIVSADCGENWTTVFSKGGTELATHTDNGSNRWPESLDEWGSEVVEITAFAGQEVLVGFETVNRKGNHLLLDNINIYSGWLIGISDNELENLSLYPNPNNGAFRFNGWKDGMRFSYTVCDAKGQTVAQGTLASPELQLPELSPGLYLTQLQDGDDIRTFRIMLTE